MEFFVYMLYIALHMSVGLLVGRSVGL